MDFEQEMEKNPMYNPYEYMEPHEIAELENRYANYSVKPGHAWYLPEGKYIMEIVGASNYKYKEMYMFSLKLRVEEAQPENQDYVGATSYKRYSMERQLHFLKMDLATIGRVPDSVVEIGSFDFRQSLIGIRLQTHVAKNRKGFISIYIDALAD